MHSFKYHRCLICGNILDAEVQCPQHTIAKMVGCNKDGYVGGFRVGDPMPYVNMGPVTPDEYRYAHAHMRQALAELEQVLHYAGRDPDVSEQLALTAIPDLLLPLRWYLRDKAAGK